MIRLNILLIIASVASPLFAQNANIEVIYEERTPLTHPDGKGTLMRLLANNENSKYFNDISLWTDSLNSTPTGRAKYKEIIDASCLVKSPEGYDYYDFTKGPIKRVYTYIFNNLADTSLTVYDMWGDEQGYYTEPITEQQWDIIADSTTNILGYECILAKSNYHGRQWNAWFTPDIPLTFGPWKLHGLPGLILKGEDSDGFIFTAIGLQTTDKALTPIYSPEDYKKVERKKAQSDHEYYFNNQESILAAQNEGYAKVSYTDSEGNQIKAPVYNPKRQSLEIDYKN